MPYILSPLISENSAGMWQEGHAYEKRNIHTIQAGKLPPVHYDEHVLRPHSLTHMEVPAHTQKNGKQIHDYFHGNFEHLYGKTLVLKLSGNHYQDTGVAGVKHWEITRAQLQERMMALGLKELPPKILVTSQNYPENAEGFHDPNFVLTLSLDAAEFLASSGGLNLYGTSWKSSDFKPGSGERPIHNKLFETAVILENLKLNEVPEGIYFMVAAPLPLVGASESPVVPMLFTKDDIEEQL